MILVTHAIVGGALGRFFPNDPIAAFVVGFASHFVMDAIPHWHYHLRSVTNPEKRTLHKDMKLGWNFVLDLFIVGLDCISGFVILYLAYYGGRSLDATTWPVFWGAIGGVLPDALQFVYFKTHWRWLAKLQKFHIFTVHSETLLDDRPLIGITSQILIALAALALPVVVRFRF